MKKSLKLKELIEQVIEKRVNERLLVEKFGSPLLSQLWTKIKASKDQAGQKELFKILRSRKHLGPVAWDKIPSDAVEKITAGEARRRNDHINLWVTNRDVGIDSRKKGYDYTSVPVLAVTRGRKSLWVNGGESQGPSTHWGRGQSAGADQKMGGMGIQKTSFKSIEPYVDYVISIDMFKAKSTDTSDLQKSRKEAQRGADLRFKKHKDALTKYISRDNSSTGESYTFVKDAFKGMAKLNIDRYQSIIATRASKQGSGKVDAVIREVMEISNKLTQKLVSDKPSKSRDTSDFDLGFKDDRYGFGANDIINLVSNAFRNYEYCINSLKRLQAADMLSDYHKRSYKSHFDSLKRNLVDMKKYAQKAGI